MMNEERRTSASHLTDAELAGVIDGQLDLPAGRRARGHLAACAECEARLDALRDDSERVSAWVAGLPVEDAAPDDRARAVAAVEGAVSERRVRGLRRAALLRVAAALVALFAAALATTPGRAWMGDRVESLAGARPAEIGELLLARIGLVEDGPETLGMRTVPTIQAAPPADDDVLADVFAEESQDAAAAPVVFSPDGPEVVLEFRSRQEAGTATFRFRDAARATARVTAGAAGERLVPRPDGLEVRNGSRSVAAYEVTVPTRYRVLRVRIADGHESVIHIAPSQEEWIWTLDLDVDSMR